MRHKILVFMGAMLINAPAALGADVILTSIPNASVVGKGVLTYAFWDVYEATLYAPRGKWDPSKPFALSIEYFHNIDGADIADKSVQEMRKQGFNDEVRLAAWNTQMKAIFPDVTKGTVLSATYTPGLETVFYHGNKKIGAIRGDDFGKLFFGIWLDERASHPELRRALLGP